MAYGSSSSLFSILSDWCMYLHLFRTEVMAIQSSSPVDWGSWGVAFAFPLRQRLHQHLPAARLALQSECGAIGKMHWGCDEMPDIRLPMPHRLAGGRCVMHGLCQSAVCASRSRHLNLSAGFCDAICNNAAPWLDCACLSFFAMFV